MNYESFYRLQFPELLFQKMKSRKIINNLLMIQYLFSYCCALKYVYGALASEIVLTV